MPRDVVILDFSFPAGADLSSSQYLFVKVNSSGQAVLCSVAGEAPTGILQNKPTSGQSSQVRLGGITKVVAGAAITRGARVATDANGKAKTAVASSGAGITGSYVLGIALESASGANELIDVLITMEGAIPTTPA